MIWGFPHDLWNLQLKQALSPQQALETIRPRQGFLAQFNALSISVYSIVIFIQWSMEMHENQIRTMKLVGKIVVIVTI